MPDILEGLVPVERRVTPGGTYLRYPSSGRVVHLPGLFTETNYLGYSIGTPISPDTPGPRWPRYVVTADGQTYAPDYVDIAPDEVQPTAGATAADPSALPTPGQPAAPPAPEPAPGATPAETATDAASRAQTNQAETYSVAENGAYTDPYADDQGIVVNVYTLRFYEEYTGKPDDSAVAVDLPYVQRVTMQAPNAVSRTRSMSGEVYAEHQGFIQRTFVIEGRSGPVWNADGGDQLTVARFTAFRNFLELYGKTSANNKNALVRYKNTQLVFSSTFEAEEHFCEVVNFNYRRSSDTSTYSFEYSITLVTNGPTGRKFNSGSLVAGNAGETWEEPANQFLKLAPRLTEEALRELFDVGASATRAALNTVENFHDRLQETAVAFSKPVLQSMTCSAINDLRTSVSVLNGAVDLGIFASPDLQRARTAAKQGLAWTSFGLDLAHRFKGISGLGCSVPAWTDLYYQIVPYVTAGVAVVQYLKNLFGNNRGYDYTYRIENVPPVRAGLLPTFDQGPERPFTAVNYFLPSNATDAYSIAALVLGNSDLYWTIINLNNFRDAYTRADGTPLSPGSSVLVPSTDVSRAKDNDVFGTDLLLVNGDLMLVGNNDVMRVSGYANYTQNLLNRMKTPRGTNRVFPNHGLLPRIHSTSDSTIPAIIRTDVRDQVMQDHRTDEVRNIVLTELGDKVQVSMVVKAIAGTQRTFKFNYDLNSQVTA